MTATYSGDPSSSDKDKVRFLLGDTNVAEAKLQDEEINFLLTEWNDEYLAAAEGAQQLSASAASWMSYTADGNSLDLDTLQAKYSLLADQLRAQFRRQNRVPIWNAEADRGEWEAFAEDDSVVPSVFREAMQDNRRLESPYFGGATREDLLNEDGYLPGDGYGAV